MKIEDKKLIREAVRELLEILNHRCENVPIGIVLDIISTLCGCIIAKAYNELPSNIFNVFKLAFKETIQEYLDSPPVIEEFAA